MKKEIWTVFSVDEESDSKTEICHVGSRCNLNDALDLLVDYIVERLELRPDIRYAMLHDLQHPEADYWIMKRCNVPIEELRYLFRYKIDDGWRMPKKVEDAVRGYLRAIVDVDWGYDIETGPDSDIGYAKFTFGADENELEEKDGQG